MAMLILQQVYVRCADDLNTFLANCKGLRPVQTKEITEELSKQEKVQMKGLEKLFDKGEDGLGGDASANNK